MALFPQGYSCDTCCHCLGHLGAGFPLSRTVTLFLPLAYTYARVLPCSTSFSRSCPGLLFPSHRANGKSDPTYCLYSGFLLNLPRTAGSWPPATACCLIQPIPFCLPPPASQQLWTLFLKQPFDLFDVIFSWFPPTYRQPLLSLLY